MKGNNPINVFSILLVVSYLLSACAGIATPTTSAGNDKTLARPVVYMGVVESIIDDQWVINGITVTVDPSVVQDGPFSTGDRVKVEGVVNEDGSLTISRVEAVDPEDASTLPELGGDDDSNSNDDNVNETNSSDDNTNNSNTNDGNSNDTNANNDNGRLSNSNDDNGSANSNDEDDNNDNSSNSNDDDEDDDDEDNSND